MPEPQEIRPTEQVSVRDFHDTYRDLLRLDLVAGDRGLDKVISEKSLNRPALALTGYFKEFAHRRLQVLGAGEIAYLQDQSPEIRAQRLEAILRHEIPALVITGGRHPDDLLVRLAETHAVPLFRTELKSEDFIHVPCSCCEHDYCPLVCVSYLTTNSEPIHFGQIDVKNHCIRILFDNSANCNITVHLDSNFITVLHEIVADDPCEFRVIFDQ